jgi:phosphoglycerate kinase
VHGSSVRDNFRIQKSLATIELLRKEGACVIVGSHFGRDGASIRPIVDELRKFIPASFVPEVVGPHVAHAVSTMRSGEVIILENLRRDPREEGNDTAFTEMLASGMNCYVNDAFAASHRAHASIVGLPKVLPRYAGLLFLDEVVNLTGALHPMGRSVAILGGAKFETKVPLIEKLLDVYETVVVAGAIANDFFKLRGYNVGTSLVSGFPPERFARLASHPNLILPTDVTVASAMGTVVKHPSAVTGAEKIVDVGTEMSKRLTDLVSGADFVLWNGPLGHYEDGYTKETDTLALAIAHAGAHSVVGGGDTVAAIAHLNLEDKFDFLSTAGGAMLEFLLKGTLPGIEALRG